MRNANSCVFSKRTRSESCARRLKSLAILLTLNPTKLTQTTFDKKYQADLDAVRLMDDERYTKLKSDREEQIQIMERELEDMKATYQLNQEKLQYNLRVLQGREKENKDTVTFQKRKFKRMKEAAAALKSKCEAGEKRFQQENDELTEDFARVTKLYKELRRKAKRSEKINLKKYKETWAMKEEQVMELVEEVMQADRVIHEQILGLPDWEPPALFTAASAAAGGRSGMSRGGVGFPSPAKSVGGSVITDHSFAASPKRASLAAAGFPSNASEAGRSVNAPATPSSGQTAPHTGATQGTGPTAGVPGVLGYQPRFSPETVRAALRLVSEEMVFMFDRDVLDAMPLVENEEDGEEGGDIYQTEAIMKAFGLEDQEDLDDLVAIFFSPNAERANEETCVHRNDVAKALRRFLEGQTSATPAGGTGLSQAGGVRTTIDSPQKGKPGGTFQSPGKNVARNVTIAPTAEKRRRRRDKDREHWSKLQGILPAEKYHIWGVLETSLAKYVNVLEDRARLVEKIENAEAENMELKNLVRTYLEADINHHLIIAPTQTIDFSHLLQDLA